VRPPFFSDGDQRHRQNRNCPRPFRADTWPFRNAGVQVTPPERFLCAWLYVRLPPRCHDPHTDLAAVHLWSTLARQHGVAAARLPEMFRQTMPRTGAHTQTPLSIAAVASPSSDLLHLPPYQVGPIHGLGDPNNCPHKLQPAHLCRERPCRPSEVSLPDPAIDAERHPYRFWRDTAPCELSTLLVPQQGAWAYCSQFAIKYGQLDMCKALIDAGADMYVEDHRGRSVIPSCHWSHARALSPDGFLST
jgi:hypothetical protein